MPDHSHFIVSIIEQVAAEMDDRLQVELSERDHLAATTAIAKAAVRGLQRGGAETSGQMNDHWQREMRPRLAALLPNVDLPEVVSNLHLEFTEADPWAERYGGDD